MPVLLKAKGKTTTDHISPAGPWLRYRGHLDRFSDNMFMGAVNAFSGAVGIGRNVLTGVGDQPFAAIARDYKAARRQVGGRSATPITARAARASTRHCRLGCWVGPR